MSSNKSPKVWFITGCSSGFGASLTEEVLSRGDRVIATARNIKRLDALKKAGADVLQLDVTASLTELKSLAQQAHELHGQIDFLVNNAGYVQQGSLEELTPEDCQNQFNTNVFGLLNVTRAFLPFMRAAKSGVIANISSTAAWQGAAGAGMYCASKWAVSSISETMTQELAEFGIKACCIEPGYFRSNLLSASNTKVEQNRIPEYDGTAARNTADAIVNTDNKQPGDVNKGVKVIVDVLTQKTGKEIPIRLALGSDAYVDIKRKCEETSKLLDEWKDISTPTDHDDVVKQ